MAGKAFSDVIRSVRQYPCHLCPIKSKPVFRKFTNEELEFVAQLKSGELVAEKGSTILTEGANSAHVYTILAGWGFRYKTLEDGRRQILNFVLPGEFIGLQAAVMNKMDHSVEALSDMLLCVFQRERIWELFKYSPSLSFDVTWLAAREERLVDEHLLNVGRRSAAERMAFLFLHLYDRAEAVGLTTKRGMQIPFTQQHIADALGLSLVHTNKTLRKLQRANLLAWDNKLVTIRQREALEVLAKSGGPTNQVRPLI
ncbi:MAG: Crp/Fnr family transcriptional regulator, partial [Beijerinckiaceae bacterium]